MVPFLDMEVEAFDPNIIAWMAKDEHGKSVLYAAIFFGRTRQRKNDKLDPKRRSGKNGT